MEVPDANFSIKAPGGHQAGDGGVKGHAPGGPAVAHQRVEALPRLDLGDVDVVVDVGGGHQRPGRTRSRLATLAPTLHTQHNDANVFI